MILRNFIATLKRFKLASVLNIVGLSVAFAAFILIMMQVTYEYGYGKTDSKYQRIFRLEEHDDFQGAYGTNLWLPNADALFSSIPEVEAVAEMLFQSADVSIMHQGTPLIYRNEPLMYVFNDITPVFDIEMKTGTFESVLSPNQAVISESHARRFFGNEDPVGQSLSVNKRSYTVSGVYKDMPENATLRNGIFIHRTAGVKNFFLLLRSPQDTGPVLSTINEAEAAGQYRLTNTGEAYFASDMGYNLFLAAGKRNTTNLLLAAAILIIVIAAINFVNFWTALIPVRVRSLNTRMVLGESIASLRRTILFEGLGTALLAFLLALLIVAVSDNTALTGLLRTGNVSLADHVGLIALTALVAVVTGGVSGVYPAFYATAFEPAMVLKGSVGSTSKGKKLRTALISFQYVASFTLMILAFFIYRQNRYMLNTPLGYNKDNLLYVNLNSGDILQRQVIVDELKQNPRIREIARGGAFGTSDYDLGFGALTPDGDTLILKTYGVSPGFLQTMEIPLAEGRYLTENDPTEEDAFTPGFNRPLSIMINRYTAQRYNLRVDTLLSAAFGEVPIHIAGITENYIGHSLHSPAEISGFVLSPYSSVLFIRIENGHPEKTVTEIREVLKKHDPTELWTIRSYDDVLEGLYSKERQTAGLIGIFTLLAVLISLVGVFGLVVFETQYRAKEIGIRKINGATTGEILGMFNGSFVRIVAVCFVIAAPVAYYFVRQWLDGFAYRIPVYWWIFALALAIVLAITLVTVTLQSYRVANENPVHSIKAE